MKKPSTKDHPPKTKVQQYVEQYCKKTGVCATSPAYRPTSPAYPPTSPPYVPTSPSYNSISSTSLFDDTKILEVPSVWMDKDFLEVLTNRIIKILGKKIFRILSFYNIYLINFNFIFVKGITKKIIPTYNNIEYIHKHTTHNTQHTHIYIQQSIVFF